ncbi:MAG: cytochrome c biogenesis protein CcsA [Euryarchaeota archaeon]|nr:cytochrome c biogenesis protein CcsA [Euryarchaeota archaeon]
MNGEDLLLWVALVSSSAAFTLVVRNLWNPGARAGPVARLLTATNAALFFATGLLVFYFLTYNFQVEYVHSYTSRDTPWYYRVAGLWGGQKGTVLLWAAFSALWLTLNHRIWERKAAAGLVPDPDAMRRVNAWILAVGLGVVIAFEVLLLVGGTFERTDPYLFQARPDGTGLQPVLRTPFMIIHPPLQFVGYAFGTLLFAGGIAAVVTRRPEWADVALPWTRWAFLVATVGLGLGGLWAYYVLNFGGYWAWDPVETANLLAWFPILLLVHSLLYFRKRRMFAAAAPLFAVLTLVADLFSTFATRTGLWVSVHAFTDPSRNFAADPLVRLLNILDTSPILRWLGAMLVASIFVALAAYLKRIHDDALESRTGARAAPLTARIGIGVLAALSLLAFLDVGFVLSAVFELADRITFGNAAFGLGILAFGAALVFASPGLAGKDEAPGAEKKTFWDRYIATPQLVFLGVVLLSLAFLVTFLLQVLSVNGYNRAVYEQRAPIVALPILLVLPVALTHQVFGKRRAVEISAAAGLLGVFMALVGRELWELLLVLPALLWAIVQPAHAYPLRVRRPAPVRLVGARWVPPRPRGDPLLHRPPPREDRPRPPLRRRLPPPRPRLHGHAGARTDRPLAGGATEERFPRRREGRTDPFLHGRRDARDPKDRRVPHARGDRPRPPRHRPLDVPAGPGDGGRARSGGDRPHARLHVHARGLASGANRSGAGCAPRGERPRRGAQGKRGPRPGPAHDVVGTAAPLRRTCAGRALHGGGRVLAAGRVRDARAHLPRPRGQRRTRFG